MVESQLIPANKPKQNYPNKDRYELSANEIKFIAEIQKDPTNHSRAARLAFPDCSDPSQKAWKILEKPKVWKAYCQALKVWNKILNVPKLLKNLDESLNATKLVSVEDTGNTSEDGNKIYIEREVPDHQARNVARSQALNILGMLDRNKLLGQDEAGAPVQILVMGQVTIGGKPLEIKSGG